MTLDNSWALPSQEHRYLPGIDFELDWIRVTGMSTQDRLEVWFRLPPAEWQSSQTCSLTDELTVEIGYALRDGGGFEAFTAASGTLVTPRLIQNEVDMMSGILTVDCPDGGQLVVRMHNVYP